MSIALAVLSEVLMISSAIAVALGWSNIRRHRVQAHRRLMLTATFLGGGFFVTYVLRTLTSGDTAFGGPARYSAPYQVFLQTHTILATVAAVLGIVTLRRALRGRFAQHRAVAPWTATLWFIAAGTGLAVFLLLYVIFPPGPTVNVVRALLGR